MSAVAEPEAVDDVALEDSLSVEERNQLRSKQYLLEQKEGEAGSTAIDGVVQQYGFCGMIRHGERADNVRYEELGVEVEHMLDPPLTPLGFR